ncbi:MAG TPA: TAT-variant-translocated molybdopterin oxidoreductase, partial [Verrucomicrobiae bacterium]
MNSNPTNSTPANGRRYWRSLDELADTPEFKDWLHREFPSGASEMEDGQSRRNFLKIMSASFALAGIATLGAGCRRPEEHLEPFGQQPADYTFGDAQYFATAMPTRTGAIPLVVKSYEGRPVKIEGNSLFPGSNGGTDRYAQASILDLYDPDRARHFKHDGKQVSRDEALKFLGELSQKFSANGGEGLAFLAESSTSPSRARLQKIIAQKFPKSKWFTYDAIDSGIHQRAATQAFGQPVKPVFHFDKAKVILSLDCDFLGGEDDAHNHIRKFAASRKAGDGMSRLYAVESLFTLTGANADHRLRIQAKAVREIVGYFATQCGAAGGGGAVAGDNIKFIQDWIAVCAKDLVAAGKDALVVAGQRQPIEVHVFAQAINSALGAIGNTVTLIPVEQNPSADLSGLNSGAIDTIVILGGNPAYNLNSLPSTKTTVRFGYYEDETSEKANWNFPATHYLESWGDATTGDGIVVPIQPLIQPLFGGLSELEFLWRIVGKEEYFKSYMAVRTTGFGFSDEEKWKKFLFNGFLADSAAQPVSAKFIVEKTPAYPVSVSNVPSLEVIFFRDAKVDDGRYANNGWMQE